MTQQTLNPKDYLDALLCEYESLKSEIRLRTNIRYGFIAAFTVGILATLKMLLDNDLILTGRFFELFIFIFFIPSLWFIAMSLQITVIAQIERLGKAICILEYKIELLFTNMGNKKVNEFINTIDKKVKAVNGIEKISISLGSPINWHRLILSRKRFWDNVWYRIGLPLLLPVLLSMIGPILLQKLVSWWSIYYTIVVILFYLSVALMIFFVARHPIAFGNLENIVLPKINKGKK